jgi:hypothetical protein
VIRRPIKVVGLGKDNFVDLPKKIAIVTYFHKMFQPFPPPILFKYLFRVDDKEAPVD